MVMTGLVFGGSLDYHLTGYKPSPYIPAGPFFGLGLDVDGGAIGGGAYYFYSSSSLMPLCVPFLAWLMILAYPTPVPPSRNYAEVAAVLGCASGWVLGSAWCLGGLLLRGRELATTSPAAWLPGSTAAPSEGFLALVGRVVWGRIGGDGDGSGTGAGSEARHHPLSSSFFYHATPPWMELPPNRNLHLHSDCVKHIPCLSTDCLWMVALRTLIGLALLIITQVAAAHFFAQVMPRFTCLGPRKFQVDCMKAVLRRSRINDVLGDLLRLHELLPKFPHHHQLAATDVAVAGAAVPRVPMESSTPGAVKGQRDLRSDSSVAAAQWLQSILRVLTSPKKMCDAWQNFVEGGQLVEDNGCTVACAVERGQSSSSSSSRSGGGGDGRNGGDGFVSFSSSGGGSVGNGTSSSQAKRGGAGASASKAGSSNGGNGHSHHGGNNGHKGAGSGYRGLQHGAVNGLGNDANGYHHSTGSAGSISRSLMHDEIGVGAFGSYIGMNGVTDLKSAAVVVSNLLNGNVGVVSSHGMNATGLNGVNGKNHLQASNGTFSGRVSSWRFTFTRALADLGGGAPVAAADYERAVPVYYLTYLCVGVTASLGVPFTLQCFHLL